MTPGKLPKQGNLWQTVVLHPGDMASPAQFGLQQSGLNAGDICLLEDLHVSDIVTPVDLQNGAKASLVESLQELDVATVRDPGFRAI